jgi:glycerophosphoryl diester phosphodiesterase
MLLPLNIAHRGGAQLWPENTLPAFVAAASAGYDAAELDVQLTRDDRLILFHDFRLKRDLCRNPAGRWLPLLRRRFAIRDLDFAELRKFQVGRARPGSIYARKHAGVTPFDATPMPSLAEVIAAVKVASTSFRLFIELKTAVRRSLSAPAEALAQAVLDELQAGEFTSRAVLVGFHWAGLAHAKARNPQIKCWFNTVVRAKAGAREIRSEGGDGWFCPLPRATPRAIDAAHRQGLEFGVWTVNRAADMQRLIAAGVNGICTDRPDRLERLMIAKKMQENAA